MDQNTIAIIWDFDKTLIKGYMQEPLFDHYQVNASDFWNEVNSLPEKYKKHDIKVNNDTIYLNHMITCANQGIFPNLTNALLSELGAKLQFFEGVPEIFRALSSTIEEEQKYTKHGIHVEHYIVSTGLSAMIKGSIVSEYIKDIWGCEFIENPIRSDLDVKILDKDVETCSNVQQIGYIVDNTSKTRAIFEINKGSNEYDYIDVNSKIEHKDRRVPFSNMIYIADGPSDVPVFSVLRQYGGHTFAIYPSGDRSAFRQVDQLLNDGRINAYAEANYSKDSTAYLWLKDKTRMIADKILQNIENEIKNAVSTPPRHLL